MQTLSRPNFFPGQMLDYRDFNRLATFPERANSLLCRYLFNGGGVVLEALREFQVTPLRGISVLIQPGMALLPNGQLAVLEKETALDLSPFVTKAVKTLIVSISNTVQGDDKFEDESDPSIHGYKSEVFRAEINVGVKLVEADSIELFRVVLSNSVADLENIVGEKEWATDQTSLLGGIDCRHRKFVVPQTYYPDSFDQTLALRKSLFDIDRDLTRLKRLFLFEDPFESKLYLSQLHAEILNRPYQPLKVSFLASELAEKLSRFLELLYRKTGKGQISKKDLLAIVKGLDQLKALGISRQSVDLSALVLAAEGMKVLTDRAFNRLTLVEHVEEACQDLRDQRVSLDEQIVLAGRAFDRVDQIGIEDPRVLVTADHHHKRVQTAKFKGGESSELTGLFLSRGILSVEINVPDSEKPVVLLTHQYIRRGGSRLHFEWNGKPIETQDSEDSMANNCWQTKGIVISPENLAGTRNMLKIRVERADLDFGLFEINAYQPVSFKEVDDV